MLPKWHILFGAVFSVILYFLFNIALINCIIVFLASVLIDTDHYLFYVKRHKNWNLKKAYRWHYNLSKKHKPIMHIFHTLEFLILILILSFFHNLFFFIFLGLLFHSVFDIIDIFINNKGNVREMSLMRYLLTKDKKKYF